MLASIVLWNFGSQQAQVWQLTLGTRSSDVGVVFFSFLRIKVARKKECNRPRMVM